MGHDDPARTHQVSVDLELAGGYEIRARFDPRMPELVMDEPVPTGEGHGPNAARVLSAAIADCLSASLLFCMRRARQEVRGLRAHVTTTLERNEGGKLRIAGSDVEIRIDAAAAPGAAPGRCLALFEDYCIVTESVRRGIPVAVRVVDGDGTLLHDSQARSGAGEGS